MSRVHLEKALPLASFQYKAYKNCGAVTTGKIVADNLDAAIDTLYGFGLTPFEAYAAIDSKDIANDSLFATQAKPSIWRRQLFQSNQLNLKELTSFTAGLSSLVNSGLTLDAAFRVLSGAGAMQKAARLANALLKDVLAGLQLSEAMGRRPKVFPSDYRAIVAAGEAGGVTGQVLKQIAELLARRLDIRNKIASALIYPLILILMSVVSVIVIVFVLIPSISPIFADAGLPLPGFLNILQEVQDGWLNILMVSSLCTGTCFILWKRIKQNSEIMFGADRLKCAIPIIGSLIQNREAGRFARALGTLLVARVPMVSAMQTARALVTNRYLNARYEQVIRRVPEGTSLHHAFGNDGLLTLASLRLVAVGEESGQLGPMLLEVATLIEADLQRRIERIVGLLTPALTLVIGGSVGGLILHVMSAVLSINNLAFQ